MGQKTVDRRQLFSLFAKDIKYLGSTVFAGGSWKLITAKTVNIDESQCLAYRGQVCTSCYSVCPTCPKAIELTGEGYPQIKEDWCDMCGQCKDACLAPIPAIIFRENLF